MDFIQKLNQEKFPILDQQQLNALYEAYAANTKTASTLEEAKKRILGFGKYKNECLEDVQKKDAAYLQFLYDENDFLKTKACKLRQQIGLVLEFL